jgi:excinuclease UvrABC nuclease subunit
MEEMNLLNIKFQRLIQSDFFSFQSVAALKNTLGVYIIYNENNEIIYIGSTNKFRVRFGTDLKHDSTHTLVRKLLKSDNFTSRKEVVDYLQNQCTMKIEVCETKREAEALEYIAIFILNPILNK